jgi:hypothetical protein
MKILDEELKERKIEKLFNKYEAKESINFEDMEKLNEEIKNLDYPEKLKDLRKQIIKIHDIKKFGDRKIVTKKKNNRKKKRNKKK